MKLTEEDTEYDINMVKHVYDGHVVFQFACTNTVVEQQLEQVSVAMDLAEAVGRECWVAMYLCGGGWGGLAF